MVLWLRALVTFPEYLASIPPTTRQLIAIYGFSSKGADSLVWMLWALHVHGTQTDRHSRKTPPHIK